jgi:hypothetical protein
MGGKLRKPLSEPKSEEQLWKELRKMTRKEWLQLFVDAGIFTPTFRLTAQVQRLDREGYVYGPRGERPPSLPFFKQLSRELRREAAQKPARARSAKPRRRAG